MSFRPFTHDGHACRVILSEDGPADALKELASLAARRPMVVASRRALAAESGEALLAALAELDPVIFAEVSEHPRIVAAEKGAVLARAEGVDALVALGGGSAADLAKGIALAFAFGGPLDRFALNGAAPPKAVPAGVPLLPLLALPNTASGAEVTPGMGLRDAAGHKLMMRAPGAVARVVVLDPAANLETPPAVLMPSGFNAIAHCCETLYSQSRDPVSDALAVEGLRLLFAGLERMLREDGEAARAEILSGAFLAGRAIVNARTGLHHAACHALGAAGLSHGTANAILLPHVLRFNAEAAGASLDRAAEVLHLEGRGVAAAAGIAAEIDALAEEGGLPRRLSGAGIAEERLPELAAEVMKEPGIRFNPRQALTADEIADLLRSAL